MVHRSIDGCSACTELSARRERDEDDIGITWDIAIGRRAQRPKSSVDKDERCGNHNLGCAGEPKDMARGASSFFSPCGGNFWKTSKREALTTTVDSGAVGTVGPGPRNSDPSHCGARQEKVLPISERCQHCYSREDTVHGYTIGGSQIDMESQVVMSKRHRVQ